jgi:hypothetical protein
MTIPGQFGSPCRLYGPRMAFVDWAFVNPGGPLWVDSAGRPVGVSDDYAREQTRSRPLSSPEGIRRVVHPARRGGPLPGLEPRHPWEQAGLGLGTIVHDGGQYRAWLFSGWGDLERSWPPMVAHFLSDDGWNWRRPSCGRIELDGSTAHNVVARGRGSVFLDPLAEPAERYKWVCEQRFDDATVERLRRKRGDSAISLAARRSDVGAWFGIEGAVSPDGLNWDVLEEPLSIEHTDTQVVCGRDARRGTLVCWTRDWCALPRAIEDGEFTARTIAPARRAIGRTESEDFRAFGLSTRVLDPPGRWAPQKTLYTNAHTTVPGGPGIEVMFPAVWDQRTDTTHLALACSVDGLCWDLDDAVLLATGEPGAWDGGCIFASPNLLELPDGTWALPYTGYSLPHKHPRVRARRTVGYATWPKGRLAGLAADGPGRFWTVPALPAARAKTLRINAVTGPAGWVRVGLCNERGTERPGRTRQDCAVLSGDLCDEPVRWAGGGELAIEPDEPLTLAVEMQDATVYSVRLS